MLENRIFSDVWGENSVKNEIEKGTVFVAKKHANILGYCIFMQCADEGEIYKIAVDENFRGQGIGSSILTETISHLEKSGAENIYLEVRKSNTSAISLYKKFGFIYLGERKNYYPDNFEDALLFNLNTKERL